MTCWNYVVVSSRGQEESIDFQEGRTVERARENGWTITRTFKDVSSGKIGTRKLLEQLLEALANTPSAQRPARIVMTRLDRTGRGIGLDSFEALAKIRRLGVIVHTLEDGDHAFNRASDVLKPVLRILTGALENEARSDKSRAGHARRRAEGKHVSGHPPYGVRLKNGKPLPDGPRAAVVRKIFKMRLAGAGYERIAVAVGMSAPPKPRLDGSLRKLGWHSSLIAAMLRTRTYRGVVVDEATWDQVQAVRNPDYRERKMQSFPWPLTGAVQCECGRYLTGKASGGNCQRCKGGQRVHNHQRIRYYLCTDRFRHNGKRVHVRADVLEEQFIGILRRLSAEPDLIEGYRRANPIDVDALRQRAREIERDIDGISARRKAAWDLQAEGDIDKAELAERLSDLRAAHEQGASALAEVQRAIAVGMAQATAARDATKILDRAVRAWRRARVDDQKRIAKMVADLVGGLSVDATGHLSAGCDGSSTTNIENMREQNTLRDVQMAQRKADDQITKKFIESITE